MLPKRNPKKIILKDPLTVFYSVSVGRNYTLPGRYLITLVFFCVTGKIYYDIGNHLKNLDEMLSEFWFFSRVSSTLNLNQTSIILWKYKKTRGGGICHSAKGRHRSAGCKQKNKGTLLLRCDLAQSLKLAPEYSIANIWFLFSANSDWPDLFSISFILYFTGIAHLMEIKCHPR